LRLSIFSFAFPIITRLTSYLRDFNESVLLLGSASKHGYVYLGNQLLAIQSGGVKWVHQDPVLKSQRVTDYNQNLVAVVELDARGGETGAGNSSRSDTPHT
jgi:hypothetical protein